MLTFKDKYMDNNLRKVFNSAFLRSKFYEAKKNRLHFTPLELWSIILNKLEEKDNSIFDGTKKILIIRDHFLAELIRERLPKGRCQNLFFAFDDNNDTIYKIAERCIINKENILVGDILTNKELINMPKFDVVIGNPPYEGKSQKHQQFFNLAVDLIKEDGYVAFLQPALPYIVKKEETRNLVHQQKMKQNIQKYKTSVWLFNPNRYFTEANIFSILAVTILKKVNNNSKLLDEVVYDFMEETKTVKNVTLDNITIHADDTGILNSIKGKVLNLIKTNGSLSDIINGDEKPYRCSLAQIRGHINGEGSKTLTTGKFFKEDFFTLVSRDIQEHINRSKKSYRKFDIYCDTKEQAVNVYYYCTTKFARFCLSLLKFSKHNENGETDFIPLVYFNLRWTDEELFKLAGFDDKEQIFINNFIEDFY